MDVSKKRVILVDHNEKSQAVEGIEEADIIEIIDHHRLGILRPWGRCSSGISRWAVLPLLSGRCMRRRG